MKKAILFCSLFLVACGGASPNAPVAFQNMPPSLVTNPPVPTATPMPISSPAPAPSATPMPSPTPTPAPGVLNCFQGIDGNGDIQIYCTGGNLGFTIAQLENFGGTPTTFILDDTIDENTNPQPGPPVVCVTENLADVTRGLRWTAVMCGSTYNTALNILQ